MRCRLPGNPRQGAWCQLFLSRFRLCLGKSSACLLLVSLALELSEPVVVLDADGDVEDLVVEPALLPRWAFDLVARLAGVARERLYGAHHIHLALLAVSVTRLLRPELGLAADLAAKPRLGEVAVELLPDAVGVIGPEAHFEVLEVLVAAEAAVAAESVADVLLVLVRHVFD